MSVISLINQIKPQIEDIFDEIKVKDIMLAPAVSIDQADKFSAAQQKFIDHRLPYVCVTNNEGMLVGTISQKYLYKAQSPRRIIGEDLEQNPDIIIDGDSYYRKEVLDSYILSNIMNRSPFTMRQDASLRQAVVNMAQKRLGCIPILDEGNKLCGVLTEQRTLKYIAEHFLL